MKKLAILLLLGIATFLLCANGQSGCDKSNICPAGASGPSPFAFVTSSTTGCFNNATPATACVYAAHVTPGANHLLVLAAFWGNTSATMACSDATNGTWTAIGSPQNGAGALASYRGQMFRVTAANAAITITCTMSGGNTSIGLGWEMAEYSCTGTCNTLDGTPQYSNTAAVAGVATISGLTTSNSSDLVFAGCPAVISACTVGAGYTSRNDTNACNYDGTTCTTGANWASSTGGLIEDKVNVAAGAQTATFGAGTTDAVILGLVAF